MRVRYGKMEERTESESEKREIERNVYKVEDETEEKRNQRRS